MPPTSPSARRHRLGAVLVIGLALLVSTGAASAASASQPQLPTAAAQTTATAPATAAPATGQAGVPTAGPVCAPALPGYASCQAVMTPVHWTGHAWSVGKPSARRPHAAPPAVTHATGPAGAPVAPFMAADLQSAYRLPSALLGGRQTIAVVDAFDDPNAESDLGFYRAGNSLPPCDATFRCFTKVNQDGQAGPLPSPDPNWAVEESLDLDMASATCPNCKIILVEANDSSVDSLSAAEDTAAKLGATVITNSWGGPEFTGQDAYAKHFDHPGIAITVSTGDFGFESGIAQMPAVYPTVTAVGGTALYPASGQRGWEETAWGSAVYGAGSGCSAYVAKPSWQKDRLCPTRTIADVSAVADPATPVAIFDSFETNGGWFATGGTSVAAPVIAGIYALAGNADRIGTGASYTYAHRSALYDVTPHPEQYDINPGSNGVCGSGYVCAAATGYDGPTGNGTPDGIDAF